MQRCGWCGIDSLYMAYHDVEWGVPVYDSQRLFEFLILETMQAGLSWLTILRKRENFRRAFANFQPQIIASYDKPKVAELLNDSGIIRNRLKIQAAINNAKAFLKLQEQTDFGPYLWQFTDGQVITNHWREMKEVPARTSISDTMAKELKRRGFSFIGSTICYAHMQATGMVNDHLTSCFRHGELVETHLK